MKQTECSETSANKIQTPRNHTKERTQHSEHGKTLISRNTDSCFTFTPNLFSTVITIHYSPYTLSCVWNSIIHTKHSNLNWEWKLLGILTLLQFRCFLLQVYSTVPSPRVALLQVLGQFHLKEAQRFLQSEWQGCFTVRPTQAKTLSPV